VLYQLSYSPTNMDMNLVILASNHNIRYSPELKGIDIELISPDIDQGLS
jgi:hypothetical protein